MSEPGALAWPLRLTPRFVERIWGGDWLPGFHGRLAPSDQGATPIGESWLLGDDNVVSDGPLAGTTVGELARRFGAGLLGTASTARYGDKLALLAKFLDARQDLSLQVHPDDAYALAHERQTGHLGKAEAWYVLDAEPGASVVWGFQRDVTASEVRAAVERGDLVTLMNRLPVSAGDVVVNPAGTVHAVGAGVMLFEIQQSSDLTYRLFDYGRRDAAGPPRELHVDKALEVADLGRSDAGSGVARAAGAGAEPNRWRRLVTRPEFTLDVAELLEARADGRLRDATAPESLELLVLTRGEAVVCAGGAEREEGARCVSMRRGDAVLLAASLGPYWLQGSGEVLRSAVVKRATGGPG